MDITRLRTFRELANRGTVAAAAAAVHCTPSAVSQQIKALSAELGVALTEPAGRGLRLTDAGHALLSHADDVLAASERADAELDAFRTVPRGRVRVALFPSGALLLLAGLVRRVAELSDLTVDYRDVDMRHTEASGLLADFDIVVTHYDERAFSAADERVHAVPLLREPLDVALPPGHQLAQRHTVRLEELATDPWISVEIGMPADDVLGSLAVRTGVRPRIVQRINDFRITEELVAAGHGIALLPRYTTNWTRLLQRPLTDIRAARHMEALVRTGTSTRPGITAVLNALHAESATITASLQT